MPFNKNVPLVQCANLELSDAIDGILYPPAPISIDVSSTDSIRSTFSDKVGKFSIGEEYYEYLLDFLRNSHSVFGPVFKAFNDQRARGTTDFTAWIKESAPSTFSLPEHATWEKILDLFQLKAPNSAIRYRTLTHGRHHFRIFSAQGNRQYSCGMMVPYAEPDGSAFYSGRKVLNHYAELLQLFLFDFGNEQIPCCFVRWVDPCTMCEHRLLPGLKISILDESGELVFLPQHGQDSQSPFVSISEIGGQFFTGIIDVPKRCTDRRHGQCMGRLGLSGMGLGHDQRLVPCFKDTEKINLQPWSKWKPGVHDSAPKSVTYLPKKLEKEKGMALLPFTRIHGAISERPSDRLL